MPDWSILADGQRTENAGANTAVSRGTSVTASATANTKGTYAQLIASTAFNANGVLVMLDDQAANIDYLIDLAVGAAASEQIIASNLLASGATGTVAYGMNYFLPIEIPAGVRLSARCQSGTAVANVVRVSLVLFGQGLNAPSGLSRIDTYGAATADSGGTSIDPGGVANTKSTYTQIVASTSASMQYLILAFGSQQHGTRTSCSWLVDVAIGAAASEQIILPNLALNCSSSPDVVAPQFYGPLPISIPAGTRIAARAQSDLITATVRLFDMIAYGIG